VSSLHTISALVAVSIASKDVPDMMPMTFAIVFL
jgi:hypothetical protein